MIHSAIATAHRHHQGIVTNHMTCMTVEQADTVSVGLSPQETPSWVEAAVPVEGETESPMVDLPQSTTPGAHLQGELTIVLYCAPRAGNMAHVYTFTSGMKNFEN